MRLLQLRNYLITKSKKHESRLILFTMLSKQKNSLFKSLKKRKNHVIFNCLKMKYQGIYDKSNI